MKAIVYTQYGGPEVLGLKDIDKPAPMDDEVLVRVRATTVNRTDCATIRAKPFFMRIITGWLKPKLQIPGSVFAGDVEQVGKGVTSFKVADRVFGFNDEGLSSYAQYLVLPKDQGITTIPDDISYEQAAASIEGEHYAYNFINKVDLQSAQKVLVNGATGAIGSAVVQLLKYFGADITAVCNTKNIELVKSLGADQVIDYTQTDFTKNTQIYNYVFDTVGKSSFGKCRPLLQPGGVYISSELGKGAQNIYLALITPLLQKLPGGSKRRKVGFPNPVDIPQSLRLVKQLMEQGAHKAVIDRTYSLEQISEAFTYVEKGEKTGNVIITVD